MASELNDAERRVLFGEGFGDGANLLVAKHKEYPDYMEGWEMARSARAISIRYYCKREGLPAWSYLRASEEDERLIDDYLRGQVVARANEPV